MKQPMMMVMLLATVLVAGRQVATGADVQPTADQHKGASTPGILTAEQIGSLVAERSDAEGNVIRFNASFEQIKKLTAEQTRKYSSAGTIPFRISADAYLYAPTGKKPRLVDGDIHYYMLDADGNVVVTGKSSSKQMCPT